ncbi:MAG TPA: class I SAM-dependent rRNA methyltransferase [Ignavibacteria bacterium]|nr:class I SAM-dependent rRNA methyltransferase [Ignavibacteria bacterium]
MNKSIILKKNEEKRLLNGHQWIFSNEIKEITGNPANGDIISLYSVSNKFLGKGFYNKNSLIAYRQLTSENIEINFNLIKQRIFDANDYRINLYPERAAYRVINSESDYLPGLIIDRFGNNFSFQIFSLGMEKFKEDLIELLKNDFNADLIVEKNDNNLRTLEGLEKFEHISYAKENKDDYTFVQSIDGIKYKIDLVNGQKTGFYLDQAGNRIKIREYVKENYNVLDLFCNEGGFALNAALQKTAKITAVDISETSLNTAKENARLNSFSNIDFIADDVFEYLDKDKYTYDVIILDPPSFTKRKKNIDNAISGYIELNKKCLDKIKRGGYLFTFSCSHHISEEIFENIIVKSARLTKRKIQIIDSGITSYDHPVLPQMEETKYLKSLVIRVVN